MLVSKLLSLLSPDAREIMSIWFFAFSGLPFAVRGFSGEFQYYSTSVPLASTSTLGPKLASRVALTANVRPAPWRFRLSDFNREVERSEL